jgi:CheY-like chemotaxis protein
MAGHELRHRARLEVRTDPTPLVVSGPGQLGQVILNLLLNAAHAVEEANGPAPLVSLAVGTDAAGWARVEVRDNGAGIPPDVLPHIFEPFFTTRGRGSGTGLGLAIAWAEVEAAGGRIEVETEPGRGSAFRVLLPPAPAGAAIPAPRPPPAAARDAAPEGRRRVLVVDDDPLVARSIARAVGKAALVTTAASGAAALELLAAGRFDAVICDLMMPGMTGMELHERATARDPAQASRFIFVSGGAFTEAARLFLERSTAPLVEKPFDPAHLREVVEQVASGRTA